MTEATKRATDKYKKKAWRKITLEVPIAEYEALKKHVAKTGETQAGLLRRIINAETGYKKENL